MIYLTSQAWEVDIQFNNRSWNTGTKLDTKIRTSKDTAEILIRRKFLFGSRAFFYFHHRLMLNLHVIRTNFHFDKIIILLDGRFYRIELLLGSSNRQFIVSERY